MKVGDHTGEVVSGFDVLARRVALGRERRPVHRAHHLRQGLGTHAMACHRSNGVSVAVRVGRDEPPPALVHRRRIGRTPPLALGSRR